MNDNKYLKTIKNLEDNLTKTENELCQYKEKEAEYKKEIFQLESNQLKLQKQNDNFSKTFRRLPLKTNLSVIKRNVSEENLEENDENARLLLEKEKQLLTLKEKMNEMTVYYQTQLTSCMEEIKLLQTQSNTKFLSETNEVLVFFFIIETIKFMH